MITNFKYKGDDTIYKISSACTTLFWSPGRWALYKGGIPQRYLWTETPTPLKVARPLEDVEWFEYRCILNKAEQYHDVTKWWYSILRRSSVGKFLYMKHGRPRYRFTLDEPFTRMIFVLSLMRHTQEHLFSLQSMYNWYLKRPAWARDLTPDEIFALTSACYFQGNAHGVFQPADQLDGLFHRMDEFMEAMLGDSDPIRSWDPENRKPRIVAGRLFNVKGSGGYYASMFGDKKSIREWYGIFTKEPKVNPLRKNNDADLAA